MIVSFISERRRLKPFEVCNTHMTDADYLDKALSYIDELLVTQRKFFKGRIVSETLYIARYSAKIVELRSSKNCFQELPIVYKNESKFLTPLTRIIQNHGTEVDCNLKLLPTFKLEGKWIESMSGINHAKFEPIELDPNSEK